MDVLFNLFLWGNNKSMGLLIINLVDFRGIFDRYVVGIGNRFLDRCFIFFICGWRVEI